ncbi:hypothetical protein ABZ553_01830 [Streptomyces sparsogenes]|uniref:hypothetical protein n=1 Tax=Streptomyces sparsogenes TaxID=67365 RepID=UPI0033EA234F
MRKTIARFVERLLELVLPRSRSAPGCRQRKGGGDMSTRPRLLPWPSDAGKRCYLVTDDDGNSRLSSLADEIEAVQLKAGTQLLGHAREMLSDHKVSRGNCGSS